MSHSTSVTIDAQRSSINVNSLLLPASFFKTWGTNPSSSGENTNNATIHRLYRALRILSFIVFLIFGWNLLHFVLARMARHTPPVFPPMDGTTTSTRKQPRSGGGVIYPLNITCNSTLYPTLFYNDTCSPAFCSVTADMVTPTCTYTSQPAYTVTKATQDINKIPCRTCTVANDERCSSTFLKNLLGNMKGIYAAFCNDKYLVVYGDGSTGSIPNLDNVPLPPGGTQNGQACRTRMASYIGYAGRAVASKFLLCPTQLSTSTGNNNLAAFPDGPKDSPYGYLYNPPYIYGLPSGGAVGTTIAGQQIFPTFNNRALYTPENCEVDHCNQHVGQGGGFPHIHGDSFGPNCLYSAANYSSLDVHPPQVGWSFDGYDIYGRYLSENAPGYSVALDDCGGHFHDNYAYHYHTQVLTLTTTGALQKVTTGLTYAGSTVGPHKCWKADISKDVYFWSNSSDRYATAPCCGATQYYTQSGVTITGMGTQSFTTITGSSCTSTTASTPTPTSSSTVTPTGSSTKSAISSTSVSPTASTTVTGTPTGTPSVTGTPTASLSTGASASITPSSSGTSSPTPTLSRSGTPSSSHSGAGTSSVSPSGTGTPPKTETTKQAGTTASASSSVVPVPLMTIDIKLRPAANASMVLTTDVGTTIRRALANATGLSPSLVIITSIITGNVIEHVPINHPINSVLSRRQLQDMILDESIISAELPIMRKLVDDGTIVTSELRVPASMSTTSVNSLKLTVQSIENGNIPASSIGLDSISNAWGTSLGVAPQPLVVSSVLIATPSSTTTSDSSLSTGAIVGIVIGAIAFVGIVGGIIYAYPSCLSSSAGTSNGGGSGSKSVTPVISSSDPVMTKVVVNETTNTSSQANPLTLRTFPHTPA